MSLTRHLYWNNFVLSKTASLKIFFFLSYGEELKVRSNKKIFLELPQKINTTT